MGTATSFDDDPDGDGQGNGLENFFGTDPSVFSPGLEAQSLITGASQTFSFTHPQSAAPANDLTTPAYTWSTDLETFFADGATNTAGTTTVAFTATTNSPSAGLTTVQAVVTGTIVSEKIFVQVAVSQAR